MRTDDDNGLPGGDDPQIEQGRMGLLHFHLGQRCRWQPSVWLFQYRRSEDTVEWLGRPPREKEAGQCVRCRVALLRQRELPAPPRHHILITVLGVDAAGVEDCHDECGDGDDALH